MPSLVTNSSEGKATGTHPDVSKTAGGKAATLYLYRGYTAIRNKGSFINRSVGFVPTDDSGRSLPVACNAIALHVSGGADDCRKALFAAKRFGSHGSTN